MKLRMKDSSNLSLYTIAKHQREGVNLNSLTLELSVYSAYHFTSPSSAFSLRALDQHTSTLTGLLSLKICKPTQK